MIKFILLQSNFARSFFCLIGILQFGISAIASDGVSDTEIKIAMVNVTSGPIASSGSNLTEGARAYVNRINLAGGIHGRKIDLHHYDDAYEPSKTIELAKTAVETEKVFALLNFNGTPTVKAVSPYIRKSDIPFLFPRTGDPAIREPFAKNIFNFRSSFAEEMDKVIEEAVKRKKTKFAILSQADAFGDVIRAGSLRALHGRNMGGFEIEGIVPRNSTDITAAFDKIDAKNPEVVILGVTVAAAGPFIKLAISKGKKWLFLSANNNNNLIEKFKGETLDIIISQVVPIPGPSAPAISMQFQNDIKASGKPELVDDLISFEGYINAAALGEALQRAGKDLTRDSLIAAFESKPFDLNGIKVSWSSSNHNGVSPIFLTKIEGGKIVPLSASGKK
jgi:branched-chain amino acid transport system substrate-binding protein